MCQNFLIKEEMDSETLISTFNALSGPDCLKDVIPKFGHKIKVYKAVKSTMGVFMQEVMLF